MPTLQQKEALASSALEGTQATLDGVLINQVAPNGKDKNLNEVNNYNNAALEGYKLLRQHVFSHEFFCKLHEILMTGNVRKPAIIGKYRNKQNYIGKSDSSHVITFVPPAPEKVMPLMGNLIEYINAPADNLRPLVRTAIIHAQFETIHPFMDGNGRVGRMLIPLYLFSQHQIELPCFFISEALERDKVRYYTLLNNIRYKDDWNSWIKFFLNTVTKQCTKYIDTISKIKNVMQDSPIRRLPVVDENEKVIGIISEHDLTNEPNIELILVDHNEMSQAVEGLEHYKVTEVIDHHRIGSISTSYPITFINKPVGSTSTIIATLYQEAKIPKDIASLLLCGILSDTLILQSTTTTELDRQTAEYLANITDLEIQSLGKEIITAGSGIKGRTATEVIHQDMKEYQEEKGSYTVSQIEVSDVKEVLDRKEEFMTELELERRGNKAIFAALLVTDITQLSSVLLIAANPKFEPFITFPKMEDHAYFLKDVVSRKKQLVPLLTEQVENYER